MTLETVRSAGDAHTGRVTPSPATVDLTKRSTPDLDAPAAGDPAVPQQRAFPLWTVLLSVLVALLVVASVVLAFVWTSHRDARSELERARDAALASAQQAIVNLDALSAATIDADMKRVVAGATGNFKKQFEDSETDLKNLLVQRKTVSKGTVLSAGVLRSDLDTATVLVAADRVVTDSTKATPSTAHHRWRLSMERHDGHWLLADLSSVA